MTFKKAEMAKPLRNALSMIETNLLNHNWLDFAILSGLPLHQFQKKTAVKGQMIFRIHLIPPNAYKLMFFDIN